VLAVPGFAPWAGVSGAVMFGNAPGELFPIAYGPDPGQALLDSRLIEVGAPGVVRRAVAVHRGGPTAARTVAPS
jgi:hypothetical protein